MTLGAEPHEKMEKISNGILNNKFTLRVKFSKNKFSFKGEIIKNH